MGFISVRELGILRIPPSQASLVKLPDDTFRHTTQTDGFKLSASLLDGKRLPRWLRFDPRTGTFAISPPAGTRASLEVRITARDREGRTASTVLKISVRP